jgi:hypothetical protein
MSQKNRRICKRNTTGCPATAPSAGPLDHHTSSSTSNH